MIFDITILVLITLSLAANAYFITKLWKIVANHKAAIEDLTSNYNKHCNNIAERIDDIESNCKRDIKAQKEVNKLFTKWQSNIDITLVNLIDVPYIDNELDPGYPKEWEGEVPYPINEVFEGSEIKVKYLYKIEKVKGNTVKLTRK